MKLEPGASCVGIDLSDMDWTDMDITGATLKDCTMADAIVTGACLEDARLINCRFVRCRFASADLRGTSFEGCTFADDQGHKGVQFAFSRLDTARFARCDLSFATLDRSDLYGVEMETCNLRGAVFTKVDFGRAFGRKLIKYAAALKGCNLELADLTDIRLPDCDLGNSSFREAVLIDADLEGADLRGCSFIQALTAGARLARADLRGADLGGLNLTELASINGMMVSMDQQYQLLTAMGVDVYPE